MKKWKILFKNNQERTLSRIEKLYISLMLSANKKFVDEYMKKIGFRKSYLNLDFLERKLNTIILENDSYYKKEFSKIFSLMDKSNTLIYDRLVDNPILKKQNKLFTAIKINEVVDNNVNLIKSYQEISRKELKETFIEINMKNMTYTDSVKEITNKFSVLKSKAKLWARDQSAKNFGEFNKLKQENLGIEKFEWSSSGDSRVRESHVEYNGKVYNWQSGTESGLFPGSDYQCRCIDIPVRNEVMNVI
jgi:SPP1 gp7 family putative phage head morphogenesis protein